MQVLRLVCRVRGVLVEFDCKRDVAKVAMLRKDLHNAFVQCAEVTVAHEAIARRSSIQMIEIEQLRSAHRNTKMKPVVRLSGTEQCVIDDIEITVLLPDSNVDSERLVAASDVIVAGSM